jgi:hypothetical protein
VPRAGIRRRLARLERRLGVRGRRGGVVAVPRRALAAYQDAGPAAVAEVARIIRARRLDAVLLVPEAYPPEECAAAAAHWRREQTGLIARARPQGWGRA